MKDLRPPRALILAAKTNDVVVSRLITAACTYLTTAQVLEKNQTLLRVPGALELPHALKRAALSGQFDIFIVLGAVIKGQSDHYDHVARMANDGVQAVALHHSLALGNGILTVHNLEQALARADGPAGNLGRDAAAAAVELWHIFNLLNCDKQ